MRKIIVYMLFILTIAIILLSGCVETDNSEAIFQPNIQHEVEQIQYQQPKIILPNLEIVSVSVVDENLFLKIRNNNNVSIDNIYIGLIRIRSPASSLNVSNNLSLHVENALLYGEDNFTCTYDVQDDVCIDTVPITYMNTTYREIYAGGFYDEYKYHATDVTFDLASQIYVGTIPAHEIVSAKIGFSAFIYTDFTELIKIVYTEDKNYWSIY